ncbi:MAG: transglycosylase SLT domain-containing protein [Nitrospirae bacterium]|nr:transglycosylase SLT domain-containing protein [Nitrospirota bacterium]
MMMKTLSILLLWLLFSSVCQASELDDLSKKYSKIYIKSIEGRKLFRGIIKVESNDGKYIVGELDPSFGITQMKVSAVRDAAKYFKIKIPDSDDKIIWKLLKDKEFSIKLGAAYFGLLERRLKGINDVKIVVIAYNEGAKSVKEKFKKQELSEVYLNKVINATEEVKNKGGN